MGETRHEARHNDRVSSNIFWLLPRPDCVSINRPSCRLSFINVFGHTQQESQGFFHNTQQVPAQSCPRPAAPQNQHQYHRPYTRRHIAHRRKCGVSSPSNSVCCNFNELRCTPDLCCGKSIRGGSAWTIISYILGTCWFLRAMREQPPAVAASGAAQHDAHALLLPSSSTIFSEVKIVRGPVPTCGKR